MNVANDCQGTTAAHAVTFVHRRGPVFYASLPYGPYATETFKGCSTNRAEDKQRLVSLLWGHLAARESTVWKSCQSSSRAAFPIRVGRGPLGKPHLLLGEYQGPAISFSEGGGKVWAALCGDESDIGIDVAGADEFPREYPFHRVFHTQELHYALSLVGGDPEKSSALLWSVKESVVKALGCAFHLVAPLQIRVYPSTGGEDGYTFPVALSGKALERVPGAGTLWVRSFPQEKMWLSIALLSRGKM